MRFAADTVIAIVSMAASITMVGSGKPCTGGLDALTEGATTGPGAGAGGRVAVAS
jgi:hypothetical protein